ncbi:MmpS family protein [Mycobacterium sp.]|uniref:MmpS family protein n=1 Tax=Mycobacterium sp. TaxID=1785 RepID=UPI003C7179A9
MLGRTWIPLVILAVVFVGGFTVYRVRSFFASDKRESYSDSNLSNTKPFNPKRLTYEVFGPPGTVADISYFDVNSDPQRVDGARLPWTLHMTTSQAAVMGNLIAQGDSDSIGCRITVDDVVKAERVSNEVNAYTFCVVKSE